MFLFTYTAAILTILFLSFAAFILYKKSFEPTALFLALHMIADATWIGSNAFADISKTDPVLIFWSGMALAGASFFISFYMCFIDSFVNKRMPRKIMLFIYILPAVLITIFSWSKLSIVETFFPEGVPTQITPGPLYNVFIYYLFAGLLYGLLRMIFIYKKESRRRKLQIIYMAIGFIVLFSGTASFSVILPLLGELRYFTAGPQFSIFFFSLSAYAIFKHQLLDIKIVVQKGIIYVLLLGSVVLFYLATLYGILYFFNPSNDAAYLLSSIITTFVGIFTVPSIKRYFQKVTDPIFFKDIYDYSTALSTLSKTLNTNLDLENLLVNVHASLNFIFKVKKISIVLLQRKQIFTNKNKYWPFKIERYIKPPKQPIETEIVPESIKEEFTISPEHDQEYRALKQYGAEYNYGLLIPIVTEQQLIGAILLTHKLSGDSYTLEDITLLKTFSYQFAVALEKAHLYEEVKEYSETLEEKVESRTVELKKMQEQQYQMMVDISHNLQTPLTIIKGELGRLLQETPENEKLRSFEKSLDHVTKFIIDLLKLAKLEEKASEEKMRRINISQLMDELIEYFSVVGEYQGITMRGKIAPNIIISGKKERLEEMITNLVHNSIKYIANQKEITIELKKEKDMARIIIHDTGIGIPQKDIPHLFDRFYQSKKKSPLIKGSGLGLAICKKIVDVHKGDITVNSTVNKGTTVTVTIPLLGK